MTAESNSTKKKHPVRKMILWILAVLFIIVSAGGFYLYLNFNKLLSDALRKNFNNSLISDVYELKFEKLSVNFLSGNISVHNVDLQPREKPLNSYPYINSSFHLKAGKILLGNVEIKKLLKENILRLEKIELEAPGIDFTIADINPIFFPFNDTTLVETKREKSKKRSIESYFLKEFHLKDAAFHVSNSAKHREFNIQDINLNILGLLLDQQPGKDVFSYQKIDLSIGKSTGEMKKMALKHISFKDYSLTIDSLKILRSKDTMIFHFADLRTGINELDIQTEDSIFHLHVKSFDLSYRGKSIKTEGVSFKPNISDAAMQARYHYQHAQFSGTLGNVQITGVNFDSLIYSRKLLIDQIMLNKVSASIFKDKTKPLDKKRFPVYLGQTIRAIKMPILIKQVKATNVSLVSKERKPDGSYGIANINRGTAEVKHITNLSVSEKLILKADAFLEDKAHFNVILQFSYLEPQFSFDARIDKVILPNLNTLLQSFTPAKINKGTLDEMAFSGNAYRTNATGTMKFLYHDLDIDLALKEQAKWKSSALAFAANTVLPSANPHSDKVPARIVQFQVERDMNKGFINIILKSLFNGLKETMVMSKENRKENREAKKEAKKERKSKKI